jgi:hypothetical protein
MPNLRKFLTDVSQACGDDYASAFKLLGLVVFVSEEGVESLLAGNVISARTFHRWAECLASAGWGDLLADVRLRQAVRSYVALRLNGLPIPLARSKVLEAVRSMVDEAEARSPQAEGSQARGAVKGLAEGREAKPSALDRPSDGGSLREATAPSVGAGAMPSAKGGSGQQLRQVFRREGG